MLEELATPDGPHWLVDFKDLDEELTYLRNVINNFRHRPQIRSLALRIIRTASAPQRDKVAQAKAIAQWVKDNIYYVHELPERFQWPDETLRTKAGDCDDMTTLVASMCESIGIPCKMVVMCINGLWSHIFPAAVIGNSMLPIDPANQLSIEVNPVNFMVDKGKKVRLKLA